MELTSEQKKTVEDEVIQAVGKQVTRAKFSAVHVQLRWTMVLPYDPEIYLSGMLLSRVPHVLSGHMWLRDSYAVTKMKFARLEHEIDPKRVIARLQFIAKEIAKAKRRAREVAIVLLLAGHRLGTPREISLLILGEVNEEECDL